MVEGISKFRTVDNLVAERVVEEYVEVEVAHTSVKTETSRCGGYGVAKALFEWVAVLIYLYAQTARIVTATSD